MDVFESSISFKRRDIDQADAQGRILGYIVRYAAIGQQNLNRTMVFGTNQTMFTLGNLTEGFTYLIGVAGFTSKGTGKYSFGGATR